MSRERERERHDDWWIWVSFLCKSSGSAAPQKYRRAHDRHDVQWPLQSSTTPNWQQKFAIVTVDPIPRQGQGQPLNQLQTSAIHSRHLGPHQSAYWQNLTAKSSEDLLQKTFPYLDMEFFWRDEDLHLESIWSQTGFLSILIKAVPIPCMEYWEDYPASFRPISH